MQTNNIFSGEVYKGLCQTYDTIAKLSTVHGDKFAVEKGVLVLSEGGYLQAPTRTIKNLIHGGYNREAVLTQLDEIKTQTIAVASALKSDPSILSQHRAEVKGFFKKINVVATRISDLQYSYRNRRYIFNFKLFQDGICERLSALYTEFSNLNESLEEQLKATKPVTKEPRPKKVVDLQAPLDLKNIKIYLPSHQSPEDTVALAEQAEKLKVPTWKKVGAVSLAIFATCIVLLPVLMLTTLKMFLWNPIEGIVKGKILTQNPMDWWIDSTLHALNDVLTDIPQFAQERYARQLLWTPVISDKHVTAFCKLAHHVEEVDLGEARIGSNNSLASKHRHFISLTNLVKVIQAAGQQSRCRQISLNSELEKLPQVNEILKKYGFKKEAFSRYTR